MATKATASNVKSITPSQLEAEGAKPGQVLTFNGSTNTWVPSALPGSDIISSVQVTVVGGGGGTGAAYSGVSFPGAGGGEVINRVISLTAGIAYPVEVGVGGLGGYSHVGNWQGLPEDSDPGSSSRFGSISAKGGEGVKKWGGYYGYWPGTTMRVMSGASSGSGFPGALPYTYINAINGGGGGAGGPGERENSTNSFIQPYLPFCGAGPGLPSFIEGVNVNNITYFGGGGAGGSGGGGMERGTGGYNTGGTSFWYSNFTTTSPQPFPNTGGGAAGLDYDAGYDWNTRNPGRGPGGGSGIVYLSVPTAKYSGIHTGATVTIYGTKTILKWIQSGSYTA